MQGRRWNAGREGKPALTVVQDGSSADEAGRPGSLIDDIVGSVPGGCWLRRCAEVDAYIAAFADKRDENGRQLAVRNGYHEPREALTSAGAVEVTVPRVNDKRTDPATAERKLFSSAILPPWARKTPKITEVLPLLYLHRLSSGGGFLPALGQFLGCPAGLSAPVIIRLTERSKAEQRALAERDLSGVNYVCPWAGGIHVDIRLEEHKLCLLMMIGVGLDGPKELIAPALGLWNVLREVFPEAREGRCWFCKTTNILAALPKSAHPGAKRALAETWNAEDKPHALAEVKAFEAAYGAKFPKATAKITDDTEELLAFYDYPAGHLMHLRTTNPIESPFAMVRHRTKITKGPGSRAPCPAMAFKLIESAESRWRAVNAPNLVALVRAGATFIDGKLAERPKAPAA